MRKRLELRLRKKYVGPELTFPGSSGLGEPKGGAQGETPRRVQEGENPRGVRGMPAGGGQGGPGWLHQRAQNGSGDEQLISLASDFSRPRVSNVQKAKAINCVYFKCVGQNMLKLCTIISS